MNFIKIEETHAVDHPFLCERAARGRRAGTKQFVALVDCVEAGLLLFERWPDSSIGIVDEIYVLREFRGQGIGNLLLARAEAAALDCGCNTLRLMARSLEQEITDDDTLASWYRRKGFDRDVSELSWMQKNIVSESTKGGQTG